MHGTDPVSGARVSAVGRGGFLAAALIATREWRPGWRGGLRLGVLALGLLAGALPAEAQQSCPAPGTSGWKSNKASTVGSLAFGAATAADFDEGYRYLTVTISGEDKSFTWGGCLRADAADIGPYPVSGSKALSDLQYRLVSINGVAQPTTGYTPVTQGWASFLRCPSGCRPNWVIEFRMGLQYHLDAPNVNGTARTYSLPMSFFVGDADFTKAGW
jgi:hypothetical protein